ncbi:Cobalt-precorrin-5B C(1)-methyltransferase [Halomicronema hongdechloris C2206]|uniref:Cobalt-precorrin-5B C(1)-methyltransferase n=1 Tax=Halomicronema hongdechloris C2206 TaxID=1641165 RepID=A0A1Z3HMS3_9CYAN|nr:cobalt-precorrin-5B (C(1))-methyltransferase CbiD [Halomicronema hongdechloris]ASC71591.1 Cobalt-precorrin-5B C(1)-methyltransferase [Halomicronema hongdechloris C2206]
MVSSPNSSSSARAGYTLPVFACAGAIASLRYLCDCRDCPDTVAVNLLEPAETVEIAIEQLAPLPDGTVLAISRSDPGDNLDLTRHTPVWAVVGWGDAEQSPAIAILPGEGVGRLGAEGPMSISRYARRLLQENLDQWRPDRPIRVTLILPQGRALGQRTSNEAFGVVEGLALLGTSGISQPLSAPGQLEAFRADLQDKASRYDSLVFCLGENGLDLALTLGIEADRRVKTANWLGPLLVEAGLRGVDSVVLLGYHGKLLKLAGGIFHTHHHVADGRQEILAAHCANQGVPRETVQAILAAETAEAGLGQLRQLGETWVAQVYGAIATRIEQRASAYIHRHSQQRVQVGCLLFDRRRQIIVASATARTQISSSLIS